VFIRVNGRGPDGIAALLGSEHNNAPYGPARFGAEEIEF
jgi:hypothetical protein